VSLYSLFVIAAGIAVFLVLDLALHRSWSGKLVQAVARDPWMTDVLGVNTSVVMTIAVVVSFALAGFAGGLLVPNQSLSPGLGDVFLLFAFNAVILGGLGSVRGAFAASIILGLIESFSSVLLPEMPGITLYLALIAFILLKPQGLYVESH
jgi:branched-subunit amino acid ABC-type transport system permease component